MVFVHRWYRESTSGTLREIREGEGGGRFSLSSDSLTIRRAELSDDGRWACRAANAHGHLTLKLHLFLRAHLTVHAQPHTQVSIDILTNNLFNDSMNLKNQCGNFK